LTSKAEELCVGADASDNAKFIAIVVGWSADIGRLHKQVCAPLGLERIHMRRIRRRSEVVEQMSRLDSSCLRMHCLHIDRREQFAMLSHARKTSRMGKSRIYQNIDYYAGIEIKREVSPSVQYFGRDWSDVTVEVDDDTERPIKATGVQTTRPGLAHDLADAVAWSDHASTPVKTVRQASLCSNIEMRLRKRFDL